MLHPRLTSLDGSQRAWLAEIGPYSAWSDLSVTTRWGAGSCGMFEASWSMPLPPGFDHPLLRYRTQVEIFAGPWKIGSSLVLAEPGRGASIEDPWKLTATGIGREVEGRSAFYAIDGSNNATNDPAAAIDVAIARGLRWHRNAAGWPAAIGADPNLRPIGELLNESSSAVNARWVLNRDDTVIYATDPLTPTYYVTPGAAQIGTADDDYASVVLGRYLDSSTHLYQTKFAPASASAVNQRFGRLEYPLDLTNLGEISGASAQSITDGFLAKAKGRLAWTNGFTLSSNEILTTGWAPANLRKVLEDAANGCMVRLHGVWNDLLEYNGQTWIDVIIGEAKFTDGDNLINLSPLGLAPRDLASVAEAMTGTSTP